MAINQEPSVDVQSLTPFKKFIMTIGAIPTSYLESMSYAELLMWFCNYLQNTVIPTVNNNAEAVEELQGFYEELQTYVNSYFDNLDVQNEINIKLDKMAQDGTLTTLIGNYIQPLIDAQNVEIANFKNNVNAQLSDINQELQAVESGSPLVASSTAGMTDTTRVYVNTTDGKWYYYDGDSWEIGGTYQSTSLGEGTVGLVNLKNEVINDRYTTNGINQLNPFACQDNTAISDLGVISSNNTYWLSNQITLTEGQVLRIEKAADFYDKLPTYQNCYKINVKNSEDTVINTTRTVHRYVAPTNCTVYVQFEKASLSWTDRFKLVFRVLDSDEYSQDDYYRPFTPYTITNNNNINQCISKYNFNTDLAKNIEIKPKFTFRYGTIFGATGADDPSSTSRICTENAQYMVKGSIVKPTANDLDFNVFYYNDDFTYNKNTGWINDNYYQIEQSSLVRILMRKHDNSTISNDEKTYLSSNIEFVTNIENIYEILKLNNIASGNKSIEYEGEKIEIEKNKFYYTLQTFQTNGQDSCIYDGKVFKFNQNGQFYVYDMSTGTQVGAFSPDEYSTIKPHCNAVFFGTEKYAVGDPFPILYINAYNASGLPLGTLYAHRVLYNSDTSSYSTELLQTITIGFTDDEIWTVDGDTRPYGNFILNTDTNELYAFTLRGENTRFFKFEMPELSDGSSVTLAKADILDMFDLKLLPYIQGCCYSNNQIFSLNGNDSYVSNSSYLRVIDLTKKEIINEVPLSSIMSEPESIFEYDNALYIGQTYFYKCN